MRITLRLLKQDPAMASFMLSCAQSFAASKAGGPGGPQHGCAFAARDGSVCYAYWTKARSVVVIEQAKMEPR